VSPEVVAIGCSTGGPNALHVIMPELPATFPVPVVIVQHMPPMFTACLAERLNACCQLEVLEAKTGIVLRPGLVVIAPGDYHLAVVRDGDVVRTLLHQDPPENSCRPAVDVLFRSVADTYGGAALGVVLTGMGQDGMRGGRAIVQAGGRLLAQDEASSVVWGMPGAVVADGLADKVVPLDQIALELRRVSAGRTNYEPCTQKVLPT
jgi:two-component system chemotaxis response regulator CheB